MQKSPFWCRTRVILYRVMRRRLKLAGSPLSPEAALAKLRRVQRHTVTIDDAAPVSGISTINEEQSGVLAALKLRKPNASPQMSLL